MYRPKFVTYIANLEPSSTHAPSSMPSTTQRLGPAFSKMGRLNSSGYGFMDRRIEAAIEIVRREQHRNMLVRELASKVNLSPWHFTRLFKAETAFSPKQYIRAYKLRLAEQMLCESFLSVKEVAASVGFGDRSHFSREFKRVHGHAPSAARSQRKIISSQDQQSGPQKSKFRY